MCLLPSSHAHTAAAPAPKLPHAHSKRPSSHAHTAAAQQRHQHPSSHTHTASTQAPTRTQQRLSSGTSTQAPMRTQQRQPAPKLPHAHSKHPSSHAHTAAAQERHQHPSSHTTRLENTHMLPNAIQRERSDQNLAIKHKATRNKSKQSKN